MLPRAPKAGKRILLERIRPLWQRMSFSWKVTARNLFRYKRRFFMAIVGIAGCTALLLTGLGLQNAINDIIDKQYGELYRYNTIVRMDADERPGRQGCGLGCGGLGWPGFRMGFHREQDRSRSRRRGRRHRQQRRYGVPKTLRRCSDFNTLRTRRRPRRLRSPTTAPS